MSLSINPFSALWQKVRTDTHPQAAKAMAESPDEAVKKLGDLVLLITNKGHEHGVGYTSRPALDAGTELQRVVDERRTNVTPLTPEFFETQLMHVGQLEPDLRRQLGAAQTDAARQVLQEALALTVRLQRFPD
jgi:ribosomal protein L13E